MKAAFFAALISLILMASCKETTKSLIVHNKSWEDTNTLARTMHCNFCIVLLDPTQDYSIQYQKKNPKGISRTMRYIQFS